MKANLVKKVLSHMIVAAMATAMLTGCNAGEVMEETGISDVLENQTEETDNTTNESVDTDDTVSEASDNTAEVTDSSSTSGEAYHDPNGWSVGECLDGYKVDSANNSVIFTYSSKKGKVSTVTFKYETGKSGKDAADELAKKYGAEVESRDSFPGDETAKGFFLEHDPETDTAGPYNIVFTRDYKDGCLIIDVEENHSGDEMDDMNTSDMITILLESISFE